MLFNVVLPFAWRTEVSADALEINVVGDLLGGMATGIINSSPRPVPIAGATAGDVNQQVYLTFQLENFGEYDLRYMLPNGNEVSLRISVDNNVALVTLDDGGAHLPTTQFAVHLAPAVSDFINITEYVNRTDRPNEVGAYRVIATEQVVLNPNPPPTEMPPPTWTDPPDEPTWWNNALYGFFPPAPGTPIPDNWDVVNGPWENQWWVAAPWPPAWPPTAWLFNNPDLLNPWQPEFDPSPLSPIDPWDPANWNINLGTNQLWPEWTVDGITWPIAAWRAWGWNPWVHHSYQPSRPPQFEVSGNRGFSFQYRGTTYHIMFDSDGTFHFAADHFAPGFIFDIVLRELNFENPTVLESQRGVLVNTGINGINVIPFANAPMDGDFGLTNNDHDRLAERFDHINRRPLPHLNYPATSNVRSANEDEELGRWPAQNDEALGFSVTFQVPQFLPLPTGSDSLGTPLVGNPQPPELRAAVSFDSNPVGQSFAITNFDLYTATPTATISPGIIIRNANMITGSPGFGGSAVGGITVTNDVVDMEILVIDPTVLDGTVFLPNLMYDPSSFVVLEDRDAVGNESRLVASLRPTSLNRAQPNDLRFGAFTLLNYEITIINGIYHVIIPQPYHLNGEYVVFESLLPQVAAGAILSRTHFVEAGAVIPPIPLRDDPLTVARFVQVFFRPGDEFSEAELNEVRAGTWPVRSQGLFFLGSEDDINLRTSQFFSVNLNSHLPQEGDMNRPQISGIADLTMMWDVGTRALIEQHMFRTMADDDGNLDIYYEIGWSLNPYELATERFALVRARLTQGSATTPPAVTPPAITVTYHLVEEDAAGNFTYTHEIDGMRLLTTEPTELLFSPVYEHMAQIQMEVDTRHITFPMPQPVTPPTGLNFPSIYFLSVRPIQVGDNDDFDTPSSEYDSFTLSEFENEEIPPPQNLQAVNEVALSAALGDEHDRVSFDALWEVHMPQIREYFLLSYGLLANPLSQFELEMTLYISQDETRMRETFPATNNADPENRHLMRRQLADVVLNANDLVAGTAVDPTELFFSPTNDNAVNMTGHANPRDALRSNAIVAVTGLRMAPDLWETISGPALDLQILELGFRLDGLDRNEQYFVYVDIILTQIPNPPIETDDGFILEIVEASFLSNLEGITVPDDRDIPDGLELDPMAPDVNVLAEATGLNTATIYWNRISPIGLPERLVEEGYTESLEYEIIRIRDNQMSSDTEQLTALLNNRVPITQVWNALTEHLYIVSFQTIATEDGPATGLEGLQGRPTAPDMNLLTNIESEPIAGLDPVMIRDDSLRSNTVYFYYVRTRRTVEGPSGTIQTYSVWSNVSVTTTIAGAPRDLIVETGPERIYDRQTEVMISFEAPIMFSPEALNQLLGNSIILEYQIRVDDAAWQEPVRMREPFLRQYAGVGSESGWTRFLYHITAGIEQGRLHSVRVRMVELDENGDRLSVSMWSNEGTWLADRDEDEDDYDRREENWLEDLRRRLEELLRRPFWEIRYDAQAYHIIHRVGMFNNVVAEARGGHIILPFENTQQTTYHLPIGAFLQAWNAELSFIITNPAGNMQVMIPARSIDLNENDSVIDIGRLILRSDYNDYMVRFNVDWSNPPEIEGDDSMTFVANVSFDLIATQPNIVAWERALENTLIDRIDDLATDEETRLFIRNAVRDETMAADDISREIVRIVEVVARQALARVINENFRELTTHSRQVGIPRLDRGIAIAVNTPPSPLAAVNAFHSVPGSNLWTPVPTIEVLDSRGFFTQQPGIVAFTGREVVIQGAEQVQGGQVATGVVARHGLDDFFGRDSMAINQLATRGQLVDAVARMMGAPRGAASVPWLRANGIDVQAAGANNPITNQAALQLIMLVYEAQTNTRISSIQITNFAAINAIPNLSPQYRPAVAAAVQIGIVPTDINPTQQLTVGQLLEVLAALDRLLGL